MGQQEAHEYEASGGGFERRPYCRLTPFSRSLQTFLRINLDGTGIQDRERQVLSSGDVSVRGV